MICILYTFPLSTECQINGYFTCIRVEIVVGLPLKTLAMDHVNQKLKSHFQLLYGY